MEFRGDNTDDHASADFVSFWIKVTLISISDELVAPYHMAKLFEAVKASKQLNKFVDFKDGTHNDTCMQPNYFESISLFQQRVKMGKGNTLN